MMESKTARVAMLAAMIGLGEPGLGHAAESVLSSPAAVAPSEVDPPGPASQVIKGEIVKIEGEYYVIKDAQGNEARLQVTRDTELAGVFKPGDVIEVQTVPIEHAKVISAPSEQPEPSAKIIKGELLKIEGSYLVIRNAQGKEMRLHVSKDTQITGTFRPGDLIEAQTSPVEHALFIKSGK